MKCGNLTSIEAKLYTHLCIALRVNPTIGHVCERVFVLAIVSMYLTHSLLFTWWPL